VHLLVSVQYIDSIMHGATIKFLFILNSFEDVAKILSKHLEELD